MLDLITRIRAWFGLPNTPDPEHEQVRRTLREHERQLRIARIDAGIPADRRRMLGPNHHRRATDA